MKLIVWSVIALGAAFGALYVVVRQARRVLPPIVLPPGETMPTTARQRLAWQTVVPILPLTLAAWMIGLIEIYHASHLVPSAFLYLICWPLLMVSILALLAGVVIGYRRS